jgi:hypothetical protein
MPCGRWVLHLKLEPKDIKEMPIALSNKTFILRIRGRPPLGFYQDFQ